MIRPTLGEARQLSEGNTVVPISMELYADVKTSIQILRGIHAAYPEHFMLESVDSSQSWGRYTFLGYQPALRVSGGDGRVTIRNGVEQPVESDNPGEVLRELLEQYKAPRVPSLPPFTGGFVGYFSYDYIKYVEPTLKLSGQNPEGFADFHLMLFDKVIAFDHFEQKIHLIVNVRTDDLETNYMEGVAALKDMERLVLQEPVPPVPEGRVVGEFEPALSEAEYAAMVTRAKEYIHEGDIFQAVLSNRFTARFEGDLLNAYRILRTTSPSAYMVYLQTDDVQIAGASPETLVTLKDGVLTSYPLAGTCPRGASEEEDRRLIDALLHSEKELAEHDMLVDLARNDLGKICDFGSVQVEEYREVKTLTSVSHISSKVTGTLRAGLGPLDAVHATLPAGTLSGAPKKRACEIIDELEGQKRGVYGGAVGYIDFTGNMDLCITIRTAVAKNGKVFLQVGAGIVADSDPAAEYQECLNKMRAVRGALEQTKGGVSGGSSR